MIKKIFTYLILTLFTTAVAAEELVMMCDSAIYKYVQDPAGDKVFYKNKNTNNKYKEWCDELPSRGTISSEGRVRIIKDNKATCMVKKSIFPNNIERTNSLSVNDFINLTRHLESYQTNTGSKKNVYDITCKKRRK